MKLTMTLICFLLAALVGAVAWMLAGAEREARERDDEAKRFVEDD